MPDSKFNIKLMEPSFSPWQPNKPLSKQIAVLMSGGVDSSCTAHFLASHGWEVLGITMKIPAACDGSSKGCCGADAAFVCDEIGIPHYFVDVTEAFQNLIIEPFRHAYEKAQTPNPCADCNTLLKFSLVWDLVTKTFGINYLATGHYAKVSEIDGEFRLGRAQDRTKDQSYFLYGIAAEKLPYLVLPLYEIEKTRIRQVAAELNLSVADKPESMELCFAGAGDYRVALTAEQKDNCGEMTDMHGNVIGTHNGIANYTIGQRRGLGFAAGQPLYVGKIDAAANVIALGTRDEVSSKNVRANKINILIPEDYTAGKSVFAKVRSYNDPRPCKIIDANQAGVTVEFNEAQFAPTPGQKLVLYNKDNYIIAGGTIY